jgi:hypothetical protein
MCCALELLIVEYIRASWGLVRSPERSCGGLDKADCAPVSCPALLHSFGLGAMLGPHECALFAHHLRMQLNLDAGLGLVMVAGTRMYAFVLRSSPVLQRAFNFRWRGCLRLIWLVHDCT